MSGCFNFDDQKRQQQYLNWKASQNALEKMPKDVKTKGEDRKDKKALITTVVIIAAVFAILILLSRI